MNVFTKFFKDFLFKSHYTKCKWQHLKKSVLNGALKISYALHQRGCASFSLRNSVNKCRAIYKPKFDLRCLEFAIMSSSEYTQLFLFQKKFPKNDR